MEFRYKASTASGGLKKGTVKAMDRKEAKDKLSGRGLSNIFLESTEVKRIGRFNIMYWGRLSLLDKLMLTKNLALMFKSGMTINDALSSLRDQAAKPLLKRILTKVLEAIESGQGLADSFAVFPRQFNKIFINIIRSGEESGNLEENLRHLSIQLERDNDLRRKVRSAMLYPIIVLTATFVIGMGLAVFVLPQITKVFKALHTELPTSTKILLAVSQFFQDYGVYFAVLVFFGIIFLIWLAKRKFMHRFMHPLYMSLPIFGRIIQNINLARFCRTLGTLLRSGIPIAQALDITYDTMENYVFKKTIKAFSLSISQGSALVESLEKFPKVYPVLVAKMVSVGEQSGDLEGVLIYLAEFYEAEVDVAMRDLAIILEPILLLVIGFTVGFVAISIITPLYGVLQGVRTR